MIRSVRLPGAAVAACLVSAALLVSGCAAGQVSQTANQVAAVDGANVGAGHVTVLNALLAQAPAGGYPKGATAPLQLAISNSGLQADTLTAVSSPAATTGTISGKAVVPAQSLVTVGQDTPVKLALTGLTAPIGYGTSVPVTLTFTTAGPITFNVPIAIPESRSPDRSTVNIQPAEATPLWRTGVAEH